MTGKNKAGVVNDYQLALISKSVFDIGPRTRTLMLMFGMIGVAMAFIESLPSGKDIPLDKLIHFTSYFILSATFVLALRPAFYIPGLIGIFGMSVGIEFMQKHTGRSFDTMDMYANGLGVAVGGMAGLFVRGMYAYVSKEMAARKTRNKLEAFPKDEILIREGDPIDALYIIKEGRVRALRNINGRETSVATIGAGEVLGVLGVVEGKPQYTTLRTLEPTVLYRMTLKEVMESAGGDELPVSLVLSGLASRLRAASEQLTKSGRSFDVDATIA